MLFTDQCGQDLPPEHQTDVTMGELLTNCAQAGSRFLLNDALCRLSIIAETRVGSRLALQQKLLLLLPARLFLGPNIGRKSRRTFFPNRHAAKCSAPS